MSLETNKYRKLWLRSVHSTIVSKKKYEYNKIKRDRNKDPTLFRWLEWRIAYNLYCGGQYTEAFKVLVDLCNTVEEVTKEDIASRTVSFLNLTTARCCMRLFFEKKEHRYLKLCYQYYQMGIDTLEFDLYAMFRLPMILLEFGKVLEHYGNFKAALEVYGNLLQNFPNFRGYFTVMYRTAVVGKYVAEKTGS
jgi:hypothetical protein